MALKSTPELPDITFTLEAPLVSRRADRSAKSAPGWDKGSIPGPIRDAGGVPFEFNTIGVDDGIVMGHGGMR